MDAKRTLTEVHRQYLRDHAITDDVIQAAAIFSSGDEIHFPWKGPQGQTAIQRKPYQENTKTGYLWEAGKPLHPWMLRESGGPVLIVEGTKQALAAASWAAPEYSVYGMAGCEGLSKCDLSFAEDRTVFIILDADAETNANVYSAGMKLKIRLEDEDATVRFVRLPVGGKDGLDDYLASVPLHKRSARLLKRINEAGAKPADKKPTRSAASSDPILPETGGRQMVAVNGDLKEVVDNVLGALKSRWDGSYLFSYGKVLSCVEGPNTLPLEEGVFLRVVADTAYLVTHHPATARGPERYVAGGRLDGQTIKALMSSAGEFTPLQRVVRAPFVRPDGTVCGAAGYDKATETLLLPDPVLGQIRVPEEPTREETDAARDLLMDEWLGDMPFPSQGSRANALALLLTPFVRGMFELAPLAVINGLQPGVGKNLLADCVALLATGKATPPMAYTRDDDETRKQITAAFRHGAELFAFDEAHVIEGAALARALTSVTYTDRILGASMMAEFPNQVTWMAMGNKVQVNSDCARRVYWIDLMPEGANPEDRVDSSFRHSDLRGWTAQNRARLIEAVLILVRSWFAAGSPMSPRGASLGSFERWDKTVGGIVAHAGLRGFLDELRSKRSESDFEGAYWSAHIQWLWETFGPEEFTTANVRVAAMANLKTYEAPPRMDDVSDKGYTRELGKRYSQKDGRWFGDLKLVKSGMGHRSTLKWCIKKHENPGSEVTEVSPNPMCVGGTPLNVDHVNARVAHIGGCGQVSSVTSVTSEGTNRTVVVDIETSGTDCLTEDPGFLRLSGYTDPLGRAVTTTDHGALVSVMREADVIVGHNILNFDLPALCRHAGADWDELAPKVIDTLLLARLADPSAKKGAPNAKPAGYYSLDETCHRRGVAGKSDDLSALAEEFGGYGSIPVDEPRYVAYLEGDLRAAQALYESFLPLTPYMQREMQFMAVRGSMLRRGFRVDVPLLNERVREEDEKKAEALETLREKFGLPLTGANGKPSKSLNTASNREALIKAFKDAGAPHYPKTAKGALATSKGAMGTSVYELKGPEGSKYPPGMQAAYPGNEAVEEICSLVLTANGAVAKYAEIAKHLDGDRVFSQASQAEDKGDQATGRWAMAKPSLTNLGKREGKHVQRAPFLPEKGHVLISADLDQVDMRALAGLSQDPAYMKLFEPGRDVHTEIAEQVFGVRTKEARTQAKVIGHGFNYGMGLKKMVELNQVPEADALAFTSGMHKNFPVLMEWREQVADIGRNGGLLDNGFGRLMAVDPRMAGSQAPAYMGQGAARDLLAEGILRLPGGIRAMLRAVVHDEIVLSVPEQEAEDVGRAVLEALQFEWKGVPITAGLSAPGPDWAAICGD